MILGNFPCGFFDTHYSENNLILIQWGPSISF